MKIHRQNLNTPADVMTMFNYLILSREHPCSV